jgi:cob(I)alamin adenosyltransferase
MDIAARDDRPKRQASRPGTRTPARGLVIINTGNGKGKSTAAFGLAIRAAGNGLRVLVVQFIKGQWKTGEAKALRALGIEMRTMGRGFTIERLRDPRIDMDEHQNAARIAFLNAREAMLSDQCDMLILDELLGTIRAGLVTLDEVLHLVRDKPATLHLVLTGRGAPPELVEMADLVTEMVPIKHPLQQGIKAQRGIEF